MILYTELLEKLGLKKEKLPPYMDYDLLDFNERVTRPWGFVELMATSGEGRDIMAIDLHFLAVLCKSVTLCNNFIHCVFPLQLKIKYHNIHQEPIMICADLLGSHHMHKSL